MMYAIKGLLGKGTKHSFMDFFIGNSGKYSLSRVQAIGWALLIISFQISVLITLFSLNKVGIYDPIFAENILWLLGLSLTSYTAVKGITIYQIDKEKEYKRSNPTLSDLITSENGLDFSRFQVIIWSVIAVSLYLFACHGYLDQLMIQSCASSDSLTMLFIVDDNPYLPDISDSFLVLMGLSQGAYVGKKLVPEHKLEGLKEKRITELAEKQKELERQKKLSEGLNELMGKNLTKHAQSQKDDLDQSITRLDTQIQKLNSEIKDIEKFIS